MPSVTLLLYSFVGLFCGAYSTLSMIDALISVDLDRLPRLFRFARRVMRRGARDWDGKRPVITLVVFGLVLLVSQYVPVLWLVDPTGVNGQGLPGRIIAAAEVALVSGWAGCVWRVYQAARA